MSTALVASSQSMRRAGAELSSLAQQLGWVRGAGAGAQQAGTVRGFASVAWQLAAACAACGPAPASPAGAGPESRRACTSSPGVALPAQHVPVLAGRVSAVGELLLIFLA